MRKTISILLAFVLTMSLCACGSSAAKWQEQYDLGKKYLDDGNYKEAVVAFKAAITIDPKRAEAYSGAADAYIGQDDYDNARKILQEGYKATGDESLKTKMDGLDSGESSDPPQSNTITAQATVIFNPDAYADQWKVYMDKYQVGKGDTQRCSIYSFGIRFSSPVTFTIGGQTYTASEALLVGSDAFSTEGLHDDKTNTNSEMIGKQLTVSGHFWLNDQTTEITGPVTRDGVVYYEYRPNGPYCFSITEYK